MFIEIMPGLSVGEDLFKALQLDTIAELEEKREQAWIMGDAEEEAWLEHEINLINLDAA